MKFSIDERIIEQSLTLYNSILDGCQPRQFCRRKGELDAAGNRLIGVYEIAV